MHARPRHAARAVCRGVFSCAVASSRSAALAGVMRTTLLLHPACARVDHAAELRGYTVWHRWHSPTWPTGATWAGRCKACDVRKFMLRAFVWHFRLCASARSGCKWLQVAARPRAQASCSQRRTCDGPVRHRAAPPPPSCQKAAGLTVLLHPQRDRAAQSGRMSVPPSTPGKIQKMQ